MKLPSLRSRVTYCRGFRSQLISSGSQYRFTEVFVHSCFTSVIPSSSFRKSMPIYGSVCPHSCFTSVISTGSFSKSMPFYGSICPFLLYFRNSDFIFQSRPIYGNFCKNAGYFGNSEQPAFKPTHYLKINIISPAKTAAIMGFPTMTVSHLIIRVFFGI